MTSLDKLLTFLAASALALAEADATGALQLPGWLRILAIAIVGGSGVVTHSLVRRAPPVQPVTLPPAI